MCAAIVVLLTLTAPLAAQKSGTSEVTEVKQGTSGHVVVLDLHDVTLRDALKALEAQTGSSLVYASGTVPLDRRVSISVRAASAREALEVLLRGTDTEIRESASGRLTIVRGRTRSLTSNTGVVPLTGTLAGRVVDSASSTPISKVAIVVEPGTRRGVTDGAGRYRITDISVGRHVLTVRRIGFAPKEQVVIITDSVEATADFQLTPVASHLDEVVTTVTGAQRRVEVGNAIGTINADSVVREAPITSLTDLINARVPGTQVVLNSGLTGSAPRIRIRGINSAALTNDPLLYIDGARVNNSTALVAGYGQTAGRFNDLNPEDIESIEIVKGPSAATLYGTDAANGVIIVKTKRGRVSENVWTLYGESGVIQQPSRFLDNYYSWGHNVKTGAVQQCVLTASAAGTCAIDSLTRYSPFTTAAVTPIGTGSRGQFGLQTSGGVSRFTYFLGGDLEQETGYLRMPDLEVARVRAERGGAELPDEQLRPNALKKFSLRANVGAALGSNASVALSTALLLSNTRIPGNTLFNEGIWGPGYRTAQDGWRNLRPGEGFAVRNDEDATHYMVSLASNWQARSWLSTRATFGGDFSDVFLDALQRRGEGPLGTNRNGRRQNSRSDARLYTADLGASALFDMSSALTSRTSMGVQYNRQRQQVTTATGTNLPPGSETVTGAAVVSGAEQTVESIVAGSYLEETFGYHDRLFVTGALRADGGSSFGRNFKTIVYPKASVSWTPLSNTSALRLRAAYGASGVQPPATAALPLQELFGTLVEGASVTGAVLSAIGNPNLKPEQQTELETGADVQLFDDRFRIEATYYNRLSTNALVNRTLATDVGVATRLENLGSVRNRGFEGGVSLRLVDNAQFSWEIGANGSVNTNKVLSLGAFTTSVGTDIRVGYPLFSRFQRPILSYADANGNGILEASEITIGDTAVYTGSVIPTKQLAATTSLSLFGKRVRVSTQLDYRGGHKIDNLTELNRCFSSVMNCRALNDPTATLAEQASAQALSKTLTSSGFLEDGAFTRWRELSITYVLPNTLLNSARLRATSITITGRNLKLFTGYRGIDPEIQQRPGAAGVEGYSDNPSAPQARYWTLRVNVGL
ncbi:MAG: putative outer membrane protein [Gemmatimonadetes bacterium]|nr:putative outer membrane protein [Gemmatimonadota bacterium]